MRSSPLVRRIAKEHNVDISKIHGTGLSGRVTNDDILAFIGGSAPTAAAAAPRAATSETVQGQTPRLAAKSTSGVSSGAGLAGQVVPRQEDHHGQRRQQKVLPKAQPIQELAEPHVGPVAHRLRAQINQPPFVQQ